VRRLYASGRIRARLYTISGVRTWLADERDVQAYLDRAAGTSPTDLAASIGLSYHQTIALCHRLGVIPAERTAGTAISLSPDAVAVVHAELARRREQASGLMELQEAADALRLPLGQIEKLMRSGDLKTDADPRGVRRRHVTRVSVENHAAHMAQICDGTEDRFVPFELVRTTLGVTRNQLSSMVSTGRVAATTIGRRQCIGLRPVLAHSVASGQPEATRQALIAAAIER
jgi:hypothetical protein